MTEPPRQQCRHSGPTHHPKVAACPTPKSPKDVDRCARQRRRALAMYLEGAWCLHVAFAAPMLPTIQDAALLELVPRQPLRPPFALLPGPHRLSHQERFRFAASMVQQLPHLRANRVEVPSDVPRQTALRPEWFAERLFGIQKTHDPRCRAASA